MAQEQSSLLQTCLESGIDFAFTELSLKAPKELQTATYALSSYATAEFLEVIGIAAGFTSLNMQGFAIAQIQKKLEEINKKLDTMLETPAKTALEYLERGIESIKAENSSLAFDEFKRVIDNSMKGRKYQNKDLETVVNLTTYAIFADLMVNSYDTNRDLFVPYQLLEPGRKEAIKNKVKKHLDVLLETQANNKPSMFSLSMFSLPSSKREKQEANQNMVDSVLKKSLNYVCPPGAAIPVRFIPEGEEDAVWLNLNGKPGMLDANSVYIFKNGSNVVIRHYSISEKHEANINCEHQELMVKASSSGITLDDSSKEVESSPVNYDDFKFITTKGHVTLIKSLGAVEFNKKLDSGGDTALISASKEGNLEVVSALLQHPGIEINKPDDDGSTPLHKSAWRGHLEVTCLLLNAGADLAANDKDLDTPLHEAAWGRNLEVTQLLLNAGADVEAKDKDLETPLHWAAAGGDLEVTRLLLNAGADVEAKDKDLETPLHKAAYKGHLEVTRLLLNAGADLEAKDKNLRTPLHKAAWRGHLEVTRLLLNAGADLAGKDKNLWTLLHLAAIGGHLEVTKLIVQEGGKLDAKDRFGKTPAELAKCKNNKEVEYIYECLLQTYTTV